MGIPFSYIFRNLLVRRLTTLLTAMGMALVVFVFAAVLMLSAGLEKTLVQTGSDDNVIVVRRAAETEVQSAITREQASLVASDAAIAYGKSGARLVSKELVVLLVMPKRGTDKPSNVTIRGLAPAGVTLRPQVRIVEGRMFRPGTNEIIAGRKIAAGFTGAGLGEAIRLGQQTWTVVGLFDAGNSAFSSELWGDVEQMMQAFRRDAYSSVLFRLAARNRFAEAQERLENDQRLFMDAEREAAFYAKQSELMSNFLRILGTILSSIFSIGAVIGAMITMFASVANRTAEIGTLRALGFRRVNILAAFLLEALLLSIIGGIIGLILASFMQAFTVSTMNWQTFAEIAFTFTMTPAVIVQGLLFALLMGLAGGCLPAFKAARMNIVDALRAA